MEFVNRCAVLVKPRLPYLEWMASVSRRPEAESSFQDSIDDPDVYLLPEHDDPGRALRKVWKDIFHQELVAWNTDSSSWPQKRNYQMFKEWFELVLCSTVLDSGKGPILCDDFL